jgi:hypothetical protein
MSATLTCHHLLSTHLRTDPGFAFDFARRLRDIPPVARDDIDPLLVMTMQPRPHQNPQLDFVDVMLLGHVRPSAETLPSREPWPECWLLSIDILDDAPAPRVMLDWPHRHALLRAQFRCPLTAIVLVPNFAMAQYVNVLFAVEPELTPVVVVSEAMYLPERLVN